MAWVEVFALFLLLLLGLAFAAAGGFAVGPESSSGGGYAIASAIIFAAILWYVKGSGYEPRRF